MELKELIERRALLARDGFMSLAVQTTPRGVRAPFMYRLLPYPQTACTPWDNGDNTCRALRAWFCVERMIGLTEENRKTVAGLKQYLDSITDAETGMVYVPDYEPQLAGARYYHTWDQGRYFDYLVLMLESADDKDRIMNRIRKFQKSMLALSATEGEAAGTVARFWPSEVYFDRAPQYDRNQCCSEDFRDFTIGCSQFLGPQVRLAELSGDENDLALALEAARGFLAGCEHRRGSTSPMFAANGKFYGHFHGAVSGLDGVLQLAKLLYRQGRETELAVGWIDLAAKVWDWIFHGEDNVNRGSGSGWFPETACDQPHCSCELCCTADMMELAVHLAECAGLDARWAGQSRRWDDLERFLRNEIVRTQFTDVSRVEKLLPAMPPPARTDAIAQLHRQRGVWIGGRPYLHELTKSELRSDFEKREYIRAAGVQLPDADFIPVLSGAGCCAYSALRALYSVWRNAAAETGDGAEIRIPLSRESERLRMLELPGYTGIRLTAKEPVRVRVRIPEYARSAETDLPADAVRWSDDRKSVLLALPAGAETEVTWLCRESEETGCCGPDNADGAAAWLPPTGRCHYTLRYQGPEVVGITPAGTWLPFVEGM